MTKGWYGNRQKHMLASKGIRSNDIGTNDIIRIRYELETLHPMTRKIAMDYLNNNVRSDGLLKSKGENESYELSEEEALRQDEEERARYEEERRMADEECDKYGCYELMGIAKGERIKVDWGKGYLTEREILLLKARLNREEEVDLSEIYDSGGFAITEEQTKKGYDWLMNQWKTPRGVERKNNPFGFREEDILDNFYRFEITGFHNIGNRYHDYYTPAYEVITKDGRSFEYILKGGEISIIG